MPYRSTSPPLWTCCLGWLVLMLGSVPALALERIVVSPDGRGFLTAETRERFVPWGVNYGNAGRLIEDFWDEEWDTVAEDFRKIHGLGCNLVRVHLQFGKFMEGPERTRPEAFEKLRQLVTLAEETSLYLDLTGLASYRPEDRPEWYDLLNEADRWEAQAVFWREVAKTCAGSPALFCYNLMNEPLSPSDRRESWYSGHLFGGFDFLQYIAIERGDRTRSEIAVAWIKHLSSAIREEDADGLITVGLLPWVTGWGHLSGFIPAEVAPHLDFLSVHIYPKQDQPEEALRSLTECDVGKPVVIEETFPLNCGVEQYVQFLRDSREIASGWVIHYDGETPEELDALEREGRLTLTKAVWRAGLSTFIALREELTRPLPQQD